MPLIFALFLKKTEKFPNIIRYNNLLLVPLRPGFEEKPKFCKLTIQINTQKIMKHTTMKEYKTPTAEVCSVKVESGYEASMPGVTIKPWEGESDSLQF